MRVAEIFESINGEGPLAGQRALFVRFAGCNICCSYCDTAWANAPDYAGCEMSVDEVVREIENAQIRNITITGGEPLLQEDMPQLLRALADKETHLIEIETNGTVDLTPFCDIAECISFTMDYKLPGSGMEDAMCMENFRLLKKGDSVKFVVGSAEDLARAGEVIANEDLQGRCHIFLSPVYSAIDPEEIVAFMKTNRLDGVNLGLQLHKIIWDPDQRGV